MFVFLYVSFLNMFILLDSITLFVLEKIQLNRLNAKKKKDSLIILEIDMWFISRCLSVDSLNSCFQQQKNKMSYDFGLYQEGKGLLRIR